MINLSQIDSQLAPALSQTHQKGLFEHLKLAQKHKKRTLIKSEYYNS